MTYIQIRNNIVHDYFNADYFDEQVLIAIANHYENFVSYCELLNEYANSLLNDISPR